MEGTFPFQQRWNLLMKLGMRYLLLDLVLYEKTDPINMIRLTAIMNRVDLIRRTTDERLIIFYEEGDEQMMAVINNGRGNQYEVFTLNLVTRGLDFLRGTSALENRSTKELIEEMRQIAFRAIKDQADDQKISQRLRQAMFNFAIN